ncbi:MAG: EAL domain-containing protein [Lysobacter sp.]|nr:EAL domain-containing protein [Lysobacter sp.]
MRNALDGQSNVGVAVSQQPGTRTASSTESSRSGAERAAETLAEDSRLNILAQPLLGADSIKALANLLLTGQRHADSTPHCVVWSWDWPQSVSFHPAASRTAARMARIERVLAASREGTSIDPQARVLCDDGQGAVALLLALEPSVSDNAAATAPHDDATLAAAGKRLAELLQLQQLHESVARLEQGEQLQRALYAIADMAGSELDMPDMLRGLHRIVADLMYAENFYIALHDPLRDTLRFLYFVDSVDDEVLSPDEEIPLQRLERGLTWYLIHDGKPLMGTTEQLRRQVSGPLQLHGADSVDWLGVPMLRDGRVQGVVVVQSYLPGVRFSAADRALLAFVAEHILTALERKHVQEQLEEQVLLRTHELADANVGLREQITERERGERLQAVLYRIAALAGSDESSERFYRHVHAVVGELLNAENFYIALLAEDGASLQFPYWVDAHDPPPAPRPLKKGLTEYVMRSGKPQLVDPARASELMAAGEIDYGVAIHDSPTRCWLGAPLIGNDAVLGVVAIQSYTDAVSYGEPDAELLTFVSYQIASSLQRRQSAAALKQLNAELERRVQERTAELREQIAVRERIESQLLHQVMHDALTALPNRIYLRDRIERAMASLRRDGRQQFALLYIDIDRFKVVNDSLGHLAGDVVLQEVSRRLASCVREPDVVARLAGDEFAIMIEHAEIPETAIKVARRILQSMEQPILVAGQPLQAGVSIGIAVGEARYQNADEPLRDADTALYRAKSAGRNRFVMYDESLNQAAMNVFALEQDLRRALVNDEFMPYFQPLVRLQDAAVIGYEALLRWRHPQRGVLAPGDFLQVAEDSGLIEPIDWRMFRLSMECAGKLVRDGGYITINVSPRLFRNDDLDQRLLQLIRDTGFDPAKLRVEVTEGTLLGDAVAAAAVLQRLRDAGIETALDDFGTGYSSLGQVHLFPLKMIKIDRSFISPLGGSHSPRSAAVIGAILALSNSLDIEVIAEGIETEAQRDALVAMGCAYGQGYLFGRPHPAADWVKARD